jgi:hypothetical protein
MKIPRWALLVPFIFFSIVHAWLAVQWIAKWGFFGAIWVWLKSSALDPIYAAAVIDFLTVIILVGLWLLADYGSRAGKMTLRFFAWCALYLVIPSLGIFAYFLWVRPAPRV